MGASPGHSHRLVRFRRRYSDSVLQWLDEPLMCCIVCGEPIPRRLVPRCSHCGDFLVHDVEQFALIHVCVYDPPYDSIFLDVKDIGRMVSVSVDGIVEYSSGESETESFEQFFDYSAVDQFPGFLLSLVSERR